MADRVIRGYWDCEHCGTKGIDGLVDICPSCGSGKGKNVRYYMKSVEEVSDQELEAAEKSYKQLSKESERVAARWTEMMAVDRLQEKLTRFGLEMNLPRADQQVRMNASGRPLPGQIAVARARERLATANMAQITPEAQPRKRTTRGKIR